MQVVNVTPRYAKLRDSSFKVFGWENIELISDRPFETMLAELKQLKEEYPDRILIASIMEECSKYAVPMPSWLHPTIQPF
jgi:dihydropyrimidine dehydrogenase (NADP+)